MKKNKYLEIRLFLKNERWIILGQCVFGLIESILSIFLVYQISKLMDLVVANDYYSFIKNLPICFFTIVVQLISYYVEKYFLIKCKANFSKEIKNLITNKLINATLRAKEKRSSATIISIFNNQVELIQEYVGNIADIAINLIVSVIAIVYFININYKLLIISCVLIPASTIIYNKLSEPIRKKTKEILNEKEKLNILTKSVIDGFYIMKAYGLQKYFLEKYLNEASFITKREKEKDKINSVLGRIFILLRYIPQLIIPLYGGYLSYKNEITLGQLIAANSIIWYIIVPIETVLNIKKKTNELRPALEDVYEIIKIDQYEKEKVTCKQEHNITNLVKVKDLNFSYDSVSNTLKNINLNLHKNEHIKLIGESGAGKSTLLKIICGLYTEFSGKIKIGGIKVSNENSIQIRRLISYVPQHPYIFKDTIENNIRMGADVNRQAVIKAAELADAKDFIERLPQGYDTVVGSGGLKLSGGQCKRLSIARAILKGGELFILDEPTSSLNVESQYRVNKGLDEVINEKSSIIVTHRMELIDHTDRVVVLREGSLYED